ncbi:MAG: hypothetical protein HUJ88_03560 [Fusobacterium necrophorum]|nr:hypothetical protein [Fusobacterium necrophorum]
MNFTYKAYINLIEKLKLKKYYFSNYDNYLEYKRNVILRHDIDNSLKKALEMAEIENKLGVSAYYFILLSTDSYNINSESSLKIIKEIIKLGGRIGLHFDEKKYSIEKQKDYFKYVDYEIKILSTILQEEIKVVSMHRPSKDFLEMNLDFPNIVNSYQKKFFKDFKYVSDSRMFWKEDIYKIIEKEEYDNLHILTHPFWYSHNENETMKEKLKNYMYSAITERYDSLNENFRDLKDIILKEELFING